MDVSQYGVHGRDRACVSRTGRQFQSIRTDFENACRHANLDGVTPHTLQHTFASRLGMHGAGDRALQTLGRWKEPKMIRRYVHHGEQYLRDAVEELAANSPPIKGPVHSVSAAK